MKTKTVTLIGGPFDGEVVYIPDYTVTHTVSKGKIIAFYNGDGTFARILSQPNNKIDYRPLESSKDSM